MINRLEVAHLAIIERLDLTLGAGLNVFTGETGAGKSIIVDALGLLLGQRASSDLIRHGKDSLLVTAWWTEDSASRRVSRQGRGHARLNGEVVSLKELGQSVQAKLNLHGQHAATHLLNAQSHRNYLDQTLASHHLDQYQQAFSVYQESVQRLQRLRQNERERIRELDVLRYQWQEIQDIQPIDGEDAPLQAEIERMSHLDNIASSAATALQHLNESEPSALHLLQESVRALQVAAKHDPHCANLQRELKELLSGARAISDELHRVTEESAPDPQTLEKLENRLTLIHRLQSKYGANITDVLRYQHSIALKIGELEQDEADSGQLDAQVQAQYQEVLRLGRALSEARIQQATPLSARLEEVVRQLGMPHARLCFVLTPTEPHAYGLDQVVLQFSANLGEPLAALSDVASGGELSRVMLALSTVLGSDTPTVIFDEVDAGLGGSAANAVAEQLAELAKTRQVLVVTHLAQIAARADHHFVVAKHSLGERTESQVSHLDPDGRLQELARMLSGQTSQAALAHAQELLNR